MTFWNNIQYKITALGSKLYLLIWINVIAYLLINISAVLEEHIFQTQSISLFSDEYLSLPSNLHQLLIRFWTPFTYMFMHAGVRHILFNMLALYWFGQIFEEFLGKKRTIGLYLLGGFAGAILFVIAFNLLPLFSYVKQLQRGNDWIAGLTGLFKRKPKLKVVSTNHDKVSASKPRQDEVDAILDKISKTGYDNLNKHEKEVLFRASKHEEN